MEFKTQYLTKYPKKMLERILKCFREGKDPQGNPINGWKLYTDIEKNIPEDRLPSFNKILVFIEEEKAVQAVIVLEAVGEDIKEKDSKNDNIEKTEVNPLEYSGYVEATSHTWDTKDQECTHKKDERRVLIERFDKLIKERFATLYESARKYY